VIKSAFALFVGIVLLLSSAAGYAYVRLTMTDEATPTESASTEDAGVAACEALLAQPERDSIDDLVGETIITGLKDSADEDLRAAGATLETLAALPADQQAAAVAQLVTVLAQITDGCAAVGVPLVDDSASPSA
jgi:hypothetical protein